MKFTATKSHRNFQIGDLVRPALTLTHAAFGRGWFQLWKCDYSYVPNSFDKLYFGEIAIALEASRSDDRLSRACIVVPKCYRLDYTGKPA